ncbi:MAG: alkaline phosphatase D family protein [Comamonas sp.]
MDRRQFLRISGFVTASVAGLGLTACANGEDGDAASGTGWKFPQSIASGDPQPDAIMLWTRVVPASTGDVASCDAGDFWIRLRITDANHDASLGGNAALSGRMVLDTAVSVRAGFDHTVRHRVSGLTPATTYHYQFSAGDVRSNVGRFKTAPARSAELAQLRFAMLACQDWSINHWGALADLVHQELDFIVHLGDYIYETVGEVFQTGAVESRHAPLALPDGSFKNGMDGPRYASTLADYRYLYKQYRTDARLQAVHERFAMVAIWDDHEFSDDSWSDGTTYDNPTGDNLHQPERRRSANQAWYEFMPADIHFTADAAAGIENVRIYRDLQFGRLAHLVMTDERLYRSDHIIPETSPHPMTGEALGSIGSRYMVPEARLLATEAQKMAAAQAAGADALAPVSILGGTQRAWWQQTMNDSPSVWKLWGNEVSLLRMGIDGTCAIATLMALQSVPALTADIQSALACTSGNAAAAGALTAAMTAGASHGAGSAGAVAIAGAAASGSDMAAAGQGAGLTAAQAEIAAAAFDAAQAAAAAGLPGQMAAAARTIAFGFIQPDVMAHKQDSRFVAAAGMSESLAPFFARFVLNADQWDGYNAERKALMRYLQDHRIRNVVAITGDIHSFFAGEVRSDYGAEHGGSPVMVDLVTAGISSDSFFTYLKGAVGDLSTGLAPLVYCPLSVPVPGAQTLQLSVNMLDYTLGAPAPTAATLAESLRVPLRSALGAAGLPEAQLDATTSAALAALQVDPTFNGELLPMAQRLAGLGSNPWLKLAHTDAQGYAVVTVTPEALRCEFRQVNKLVGKVAPDTAVARTCVATIQRDVAAVNFA